MTTHRTAALLCALALPPGAAVAGPYSGATGLPGPTLREPMPEEIPGLTGDTSVETLLVRVDPAAPGWAMAGAHAVAGAVEVIYEYDDLPGLLCVRVARGGIDAALAAYGLNPAVLHAGRNFVRRAEDQSTPYGIDLVLAPPAWSVAGRGYGAQVAVNDTGIDATHPDLPAPLATVSFMMGETAQDGNTHGTHCSGTVLALDNGEGVVGVAPAASLLNAKVLGNGGSGTTAGVMAGAQWAADNGAHVISMSLGGGDFDQAESDLYAALVANHNVVIVAAAGNSNSNQPHYPSGYASVISVAAVDSAKNKASFSNFGPTVSVCAPGVSVQSTSPNLTTTVSWGGAVKASGFIGGSNFTGVSGEVIDCGFGGEAGDFPPEVAGKIAHIRRRGTDVNGATITFATKCSNAQNAGAIGVIISNNTDGGGVFTGSALDNYPFPIGTVSTADGDDLVANPGTVASVSFQQEGSTYSFKSGTSMACPHVAGVAGLLIGAFKPARISVAQVREALEVSAEDLGDLGRDDVFGHGLVNAEGAYTHLRDTVGVCRLDYNSDGVVNPDDIGDFITDYFTVPPLPGRWGYAVACPGNDPPYDLGYKAAYTPDGAGQCNEPFPDNLGDYVTGYFGGC